MTTLGALMNARSSDEREQRHRAREKWRGSAEATSQRPSPTPHAPRGLRKDAGPEDSSAPTLLGSIGRGARAFSAPTHQHRIHHRLNVSIRVKDSLLDAQPGELSAISEKGDIMTISDGTADHANINSWSGAAVALGTGAEKIAELLRSERGGMRLTAVGVVDERIGDVASELAKDISFEALELSLLYPPGGRRCRRRCSGSPARGLATSSRGASSRPGGGVRHLSRCSSLLPPSRAHRDALDER